MRLRWGLSQRCVQFLTRSKWEARAVLDPVAREANPVLGDLREQRFPV